MISQPWVDGALTVHASNAAVPNKPPIVHETYTYDRASNRSSKYDARPGLAISVPNKDRKYSYDGLDRLTTADRGKDTGSWTTGKFGQQWALDLLGNWSTVCKDLDGDGYESGETEGRLHNMANEIVGRDEAPTATPPTAELPFAYDDAGNLASAERPGGASSDEFIHDAWNRLVHIENAGESEVPIATYEYNGLHWRTVKIDLIASPPEKRVMYYSAGWQLLEERADQDYVEHTGINRIYQTLWGLRYIDDAVMRCHYNPDTDDPPSLFYHLTDVQFSTVAMVGTGSNPILFERVRYDPYGNAEHTFPGDFNEDTNVNLTDYGFFGNYQIGDGNYSAAADLNRDGILTLSDASQWAGWYLRAALPAGSISDSGSSGFGAGPANDIGYCGYVFNPEIMLYTVRARTYSPEHGRWLETDPLAYLSGPHRYQYASGRPTGLTDPSGLWEEAGHFYTTYLVAIECAGKSHAEAFELAYYSQLPDEVESFGAVAAGNIIGGNYLGITRDMDGAHQIEYVNKMERAHKFMDLLHSIFGGDEDGLKERRKCLTDLIEHPGPDTPTWVTGFLIHALGDAYGHTQKAHRSDGTATTKGYISPPGHALDSLRGKSPDSIRNNPGSYDAYVYNLCGALSGDYGRYFDCGGCPKSSMISNGAGVDEAGWLRQRAVYGPGHYPPDGYRPEAGDMVLKEMHMPTESELNAFFEMVKTKCCQKK